jgi:hypothetical protein
MGECLVPSEYDNIAQAVELCADSEIFVERTYSPALDEPTIFIYDRSVRIVGEATSSDPVRIPHVYSAAETLDVANVEVGNSPYSSLGVGLYKKGGALIVSDVVLSNTSEMDLAGVYADAADVTIERVTASGYTSGTPVVVDGLASTDGPPVVSISGSTFSNGGSGAVILAGVYATVTTSTFEGNASSEGGADILAVGEGSALDVSDSQFRFGAATGADFASGGAIAVQDTHLTVTRCSFLQSTADYAGGAIAAYRGEIATSNGALAIVDSTFEYTTSFGAGGAVYAYGYDTTVDVSTFSYPAAQSSGGALAIAEGSFAMSDSDVLGGVAYSAVGGAVVLAYTSATITNGSLSGAGLDNAVYGGGVAVLGWDLTVEGTTFDGLAATWGGGAIYAAEEASVTVGGVVATGPIATYGGFALVEHGALTVDASELTSPSAWTSGGAIYAKDTALEVTSTRITGPAAASGAAITAVVPRSFRLSRDRICGASGEGGGVVDVFGHPTAGEARVNNSVFVGSSGVEATFAFRDYEPDYGVADAYVVNNDFVANEGTAILLDHDAIDVTNNIVVGSDVAIAANDLALRGGYNLYFDVGQEVAGAEAYPDASPVRADPMFVGSSSEGCDQDLHLQWGSPARDAGDPSIPDAFDDRSDIGAYGGPEADLQDGDQDGITSEIDCDDADPARHPAAEDVPDDGIDQDCDGEDALSGGVPLQDQWISGGGGCSTSSGAPWWAVLAALAALVGPASRRP